MLLALLGLGLLLNPSFGWSQLTPGSMDVHWSDGAADCSKHAEPPLQVQAYNAQTYILREDLCATFEAPFMYLLIGSSQAMLIDTGDVADASQAPLAATVMHLIPGAGDARLPLLVVHTHRHLDHRAGDPQFASLANVRVVGFDLDSVRRFYNFANWPNGIAEILLGARTVDVIPTPGHNETEVSFYDRNTGLLFSGDFLMPARLLVDDRKAYTASAERLAEFVRDRPVSFVLGGHIEMDATGNLFPWQSQYHPHEHSLQMTRQDVLALPGALRQFNGFYSAVGNLVFIDSMHILAGFAVLMAAIVIALGWVLIRYLRRRRRVRHSQNAQKLLS
jgi:glyoxylase-like metal-dependent hydrolase (beta-lactamase superfamily II)